MVLNTSRGVNIEDYVLKLILCSLGGNKFGNAGILALREGLKNCINLQKLK